MQVDVAAGETQEPGELAAVQSVCRERSAAAAASAALAAAAAAAAAAEAESILFSRG